MYGGLQEGGAVIRAMSQQELRRSPAFSEVREIERVFVRKVGRRVTITRIWNFANTDGVPKISFPGPVAQHNDSDNAEPFGDNGGPISRGNRLDLAADPCSGDDDSGSNPTGQVRPRTL